MMAKFVFADCRVMERRPRAMAGRPLVTAPLHPATVPRRPTAHPMATRHPRCAYYEMPTFVTAALILLHALPVPLLLLHS